MMITKEFRTMRELQISVVWSIIVHKNKRNEFPNDTFKDSRHKDAIDKGDPFSIQYTSLKADTKHNI